MKTLLATQLLDEYEQGSLDRRQLVARLMGLGAAMAVATGKAHAAEGDTAQHSTFHATGLDHVALNVTDVRKSRNFYVEHLGLRVLRDGGEQMCFLGPDDGEFILALFRADEPKLNHYCYAIDDYDANQVVQKLEAAGIEPRREANRVYFQDPDGITVQLAES